MTLTGRYPEKKANYRHSTFDPSTLDRLHGHTTTTHTLESGHAYWEDLKVGPDERAKAGGAPLAPPEVPADLEYPQYKKFQFLA